MKKLNIYVYNYGKIAKIANFSCKQSAWLSMKSLNDNQIQGKGILDNNVFYFIEWQGLHDMHISVDYTNNKHLDNCSSVINQLKYSENIKCFHGSTFLTK